MIIILDKLASDSYKRVMHVKINRYAVAFYITYIKLCLLPQEYFFNIDITTYLPVFSPLRPLSLKERYSASGMKKLPLRVYPNLYVGSRILCVRKAELFELPKTSFKML